MTERKPQGMSFETWVEQQIRRGCRRGRVRGALAGAASRCPAGTGRRPPTSGRWSGPAARRADVGAMLPTGLALRREREELPALVARQTSEDAVRALVETHNARVDQYYRRPVEGVWVPVGMADVDAVLGDWRRSRPRRPPPAAPRPIRRPGARLVAPPDVESQLSDSPRRGNPSTKFMGL